MSPNLTDVPVELKHYIVNGSIALWRHLNLHGEIDFSDEKLKDSVGFDLSKILTVELT